MRGIKWDLLAQLKEDAGSSRELGRGWNLSVWEVFCVYFFPLTLGKSSCLLAAQRDSAPAGVCAEYLSPEQGGLCPISALELRLHPFKSHFQLLWRPSGDVFSLAGGWIFWGRAHFSQPSGPDPSPSPSLRCLISLSQQRAIGLCSLRGDISDVTHPLGSGCLSLFTKSWVFFLLPR